MTQQTSYSGNLTVSPQLFKKLSPELAEHVGDVYLKLASAGFTNSAGAPVLNLNGWLSHGARLQMLTEKRNRARALTELKAQAKNLELAAPARPESVLDLLAATEDGDPTMRDLLLHSVREARDALFSSHAHDQVHLSYLMGELDGERAALLLGLRTRGAFYNRHCRKLEAFHNAVLRLALHKCDDPGVPRDVAQLLIEFVHRYLWG